MKTFILLLLGTSSALAANPRFEDDSTKTLPAPPAGAFATGSLRISTGELGPAAPEAVIHFCGDEAPAVGACHESRVIPTNVKIADLPVGRYFVTLASGSRYRGTIPVRKNTLSDLRVTDYRLPAAAAGARYSFFVDFTNKENQRRELDFIWSTEDNARPQLTCASSAWKTPAAKEACRAWSGNEPGQLKNTWVRFTRLGEIAHAHFVRYHGRLDVAWSAPETIWAGSVYGLESVALFSGVYGVRIESPSGIARETLGFVID